MPFGVRRGTTEPVLFVRPEHHANRATGAYPTLQHQAGGFPRDDAPHAVVRRAGADIPRIEMPAEKHDLIRLLASDDFTNDVGRLDIGFASSLEQKTQTHTATAAREADQAIGILDGDCSRRN